MIGTNLVKANLRLANLNGVSLSEANLFGTIMPDGSIHNH
ncbi:MAG: pentapeptide repeat-containing protein [Pseudanabaena sp. LacPavin_0818_WC45_MAG_42_6]|nr:pentapeptide repeat-containing protein [Pseudanabaena sp. LacPavin_0818_WC45_MAG_42_6]